MEHFADLIERSDNRGMIEQAMQHSGRVRFESEWYDPFQLLRLAEVGLDEGCRSTLSPDLIDQQSPFALPPSCDDYLSTQLSYAFCGCSTNATVSARDECHSTGKFRFVSHSPV
jgi:hypothetical protein